MENILSNNHNCVLRTRISGEGKPLLLLHGMGGTDPLCRLAEKLAENYRVIQPVMPGFLAKDGIINYTDSLYIDFLKKVRTELGIDQWSVIGYSMGGRTALNYAISESAYVKKLIIIDGAGVDYLFSLSKSKVGKVILSHSIYYSMRFAGFRNKTVTTDFFDPQSDWCHQVQDAMSVMMHSPTVRRNFANIFAEIASPIPDLAKKLKRLNTESLILWAEQDQTIPISHGYTLKKLLQNSQIQSLDKYKHLAIIENPDFFTQQISHFV